MSLYTGSQILIEYLLAENVEYVFGLAGSTVLEMIDELKKYSSDIQYIPVRHEQVATYMADGYARACGKPGVCFAMEGPGAANMVNGFANAFTDSSPLIGIVGTAPRQDFGKGRFHGDIPFTEVFRHFTKFSKLVWKIEELEKAIQNAFRNSLSGRPGPCYLEIPRDILQGETEIRILRPSGYRFRSKIVPNSGQIKKAKELLIKSAKPVILAGGGVLISRSSEQVVQLAELLAIPVATTFTGKGSIPEDHPLSLGISGIKVAKKIMSNSDLILALGCRFGTLTMKSFAISEGVDIIQIDIDPNELGKNLPVKIGIQGDLDIALKNLIAMLQEDLTENKTKKSERIKEIKLMKEEWEKEILPELTSDSIPIKPQRVIREIAMQLEEMIL